MDKSSRRRRGLTCLAFVLIGGSIIGLVISSSLVSCVVAFLFGFGTAIWYRTQYGTHALDDIIGK